MFNRRHKLSVVRQAKLLGFSHGSIDYSPRAVSDDDMVLMRRINELHLDYPFAGSRMSQRLLKAEGLQTGRLHVAMLMKKMGIEAIYRRPDTSKPASGHEIKLNADGFAQAGKRACWILQWKSVTKNSQYAASRGSQTGRLATTLTVKHHSAAHPFVQQSLGKWTCHVSRLRDHHSHMLCLGSDKAKLPDVVSITRPPRRSVWHPTATSCVGYSPAAASVPLHLPQAVADRLREYRHPATAWAGSGAQEASPVLR